MNEISYKQTAIDWYFDKIKSHFEHDGDLLETATFTYAIAKQKEKQQIIDAFWNGDNSDCTSEQNTKEFAEQYYNETYGSNGSHDQVPDVRNMVSSQTEISDEEIYKEAEHKSKIFRGWTEYETSAWVMACQWYREQLKKK